MSTKDTDKIIYELLKCINFAAIKHKDQRRKDVSQTPYINHPIGVANILSEECDVYDIDVIKAAILHDTVEDTDTTLNEIEDNFGLNVKNIVAEVTDNKILDKMKRKELQIINAPNSSHEAKLVKLADKLYNLRDLSRSCPIGWTKERVEDYFIWAAKVVEGLRGTNAKLEQKLDEILKEKRQ